MDDGSSNQLDFGTLDVCLDASWSGDLWLLDGEFDALGVNGAHEATILAHSPPQPVAAPLHFQTVSYYNP